MKPCHLCIGTGFIKKHKLLRIKIKLAFEPQVPSPQDIRAILFAGVR